MRLDSSFEADLRVAILDEAEQTLREELAPLLVQTARENFQAYAERNGYDIDFVWEEATFEVGRSGDGLTLRVEWPELSALFEFGVEPFTLTGDLHFYWEAKDQWIQTDSVNWGSETGGIPESRAVRDALNTLRREAQR